MTIDQWVDAVLSEPHTCISASDEYGPGALRAVAALQKNFLECRDRIEHFGARAASPSRPAHEDMCALLAWAAVNARHLEGACRMCVHRPGAHCECDCHAEEHPHDCGDYSDVN